MKKTIVFALFGVLLFGAKTASADTWTCKYDGSWKGTTSGGGGFKWNVAWMGENNKWRISGDYKDESGHSSFDGKCAEHICRFTQSYDSGTLKGKVYYWTGAYKDKNENGQDLNIFEGTWGYSKDDYTSGGTWKARAICTKA